jgi:hypothetical protein
MWLDQLLNPHEIEKEEVMKIKGRLSRVPGVSGIIDRFEGSMMKKIEG